MNAKFLGEGLLVLVVMVGVGMAFSSGFSNAGNAATPVAQVTAGATQAVPLPEIATDAIGAVAYSASGEGNFLANGDLVRAP